MRRNIANLSSTKLIPLPELRRPGIAASYWLVILLAELIVILGFDALINIWYLLEAKCFLK